MTGKFIVLEGIDGSGTTTQAELLKNYINHQEKKAVVSAEPTESEIGKLLRKALKERIFSFEDAQKFDQQMALLFAADRHHHIFNQNDGVLHLLKQKIHVISPRYCFSSIAYNTNTPEDFDWVEGLNANFPNPDVLIYIKIPVDIALERISKRKYLEIYEEKEKLVKVLRNYEKIMEKYSDLLLTIDGRESIEIIHRNIVKYINKII